MTEPRKLPIKTREITLVDDFAGWTFTARMNPALNVFFDIASGDLQRITAGIAKIILAWNFVDEQGDALPEPSHEVIMQSLSSDLLTAIAIA